MSLHEKETHLSINEASTRMPATMHAALAAPVTTRTRPSKTSGARRQPQPPAISSQAQRHQHTAMSLLNLPTDILRRILTHADAQTLLNLCETSQHLHAEIADDLLWKHLVFRRFRLTDRAAPPKRLLSAGSVCWRTLYANWHMQARMPTSRFSGPGVHAFAKGRAGGVFVWLTVTSSDDCRVRNGRLRVRIVVQNVLAGTVSILCKRIAFQVQNEGLVVVNQPARGGTQLPFQCHHCSANFVSALFERAKGNLDVTDVLSRDDFVIVSVELFIDGAVFEIDALERLDCVVVPVLEDGRRFDVVCKFSDRQIWQCYELLPGGWWARNG